MRTLQSELVDKGLVKKEKKISTKIHQHKKERFSTRDIEELMGARRDTYKRVNGSVRRK